jgi:hypothetical protein
MSLGGETIARQIAAKLEDSRYYFENGRNCVEGKSHSRVVTMVCRYTDLQSWYVRTSVEHAPPLLLGARGKFQGEEAAVRRGAVLAVEVGDEAFEKEYLVEAAPKETAKQVIEEDVRRAITAAGGKVEVAIDGSTITVSGGGYAYAVADVEAGLALLHLVADRLEAVVATRRAAHPSKKQLEEEDEQVAHLRKLRESFWIRATPIQRVLMVGFLGVMGALAIALAGVFLKLL